MLRQMLYPTRVFAAGAAAAMCALPAVSLAQDNRPVVVVFQFENNSILAGSADFAGVRTGIQDLLITDLASNTKIRLVDRAHLNEVLTEQQLAKDGKVDPTTAVKVGKIFGAQYAITGGFISDGKGNLVLTGRTIDIETTQIINPQKISGKADNVLGAINELSGKVSSNMNLAPKPGAGRPGDAPKGAPAQTGSPRTGGAEVYAKPTTKLDGMKIKLDAPTLKLYSQALDAMDAKENTKAIGLFKQVIDKAGEFEPARRNLEKLGAS